MDKSEKMHGVKNFVDFSLNVIVLPFCLGFASVNQKTKPATAAQQPQQQLMLKQQSTAAGSAQPSPALSRQASPAPGGPGLSPVATGDGTSLTSADQSVPPDDDEKHR